ncbi:MAG: hypothetical protein GEV07_18770 [Streptosporangiales bacterium]|nr:hypothetical protein [Streptosporangiales bacterium]
MIAISGVLVIVAIGLLVTGVLLTSDIYLWFIVASIVVSLASAVCLVVGVFIGRGHGPTRGRAAKGSSKAASSKEKRKGSGKSAAKRPAGAKKAEAPAAADESGEVVVVPGRLRYHLASCRQVAGRETEARTVGEARGEGYAACTACRPDSVLAARAEAAESASDDAEADADTEPAEDDSAAEPAAEDDDGEPVAVATTRVLVVEGQRRYHLATCQVIEDAKEDAAETTEHTVTEAREDGLTPCTVCGAPTED